MDRQRYIERFNRDGFVVVPALFSTEEVEQIKAHYMALNAAGHGFDGDRHMIESDADPLAAYPRIVHPHRFDELTLRWLLDRRLQDWTTTLLGTEPYAAQTMFYFKPPGARGQALHQDQRSLAVRPGTCLAAWMAVDPTDTANGCMQLVPGTQDLPELCLIDADTSISFTAKTVPLPPGSAPVAVPMNPGDVLFFNGQVIHGSYPNTTSDQFRRSLIAHYIVGEAEKVAEFYHPVLTFAGEPVDLLASQTGGPCGIFTESAGAPTVQMVGETDTNAS
jgi:ectoine hydroxylase-related dioxygenase (phytanoyl-CoA dioxygenase family)